MTRCPETLAGIGPTVLRCMREAGHTGDHHDPTGCVWHREVRRVEKKEEKAK